MSTIINFGKRILTHFCQQGIADRANFLKNIAVAGWALSSLAQTFALVINNQIPSKEKKFLIPQEIIDGITNITLFWFITSKATNFGKKLVLNKHILPESIAHLMENFKAPKGNISELKTAFISHIKQARGSVANIKTADNAIEGMGILTGIIGAILSNNICTPLIRNKFAASIQKRELKSEHAPNLNPNYGNIDYRKYNFTTFQKHNTLTAFTSGNNKTNMKI